MTTDDGMLSQEEIDALLNGVDLEEASINETKAPQQEKNLLSPLEKDTLGEIGNISFSNAATALSTLLNQKVEITTPEINYIDQGQLNDEFPYPHVSVLVNYTEGFEGSNVLLIKREDASVIADLMLGGDGTHPQEVIDEIQLSAVQEAMNQMMGSSATSMSMMFEKRVDISPPVAEILDMKKEVGVDTIPTYESFVKVSFRLKIGNLVDSSIMQLVPIEFAKALVSELTSIHEMQKSAPVNGESLQEETTLEPKLGQPRQNNHESNSEPNYKKESTAFSSSANIQTAAFTEFDDIPRSIQSRNIDLLLDVPLTVTVELGRTRKRIKDILELGPGSVIELEKLAGEPVDVLINEKPIAKGEVVVIDENFGVRITEIINQRDRLQKL